MIVSVLLFQIDVCFSLGSRSRHFTSRNSTPTSWPTHRLGLLGSDNFHARVPTTHHWFGHCSQLDRDWLYLILVSYVGDTYTYALSNDDDSPWWELLTDDQEHVMLFRNFPLLGNSKLFHERSSLELLLNLKRYIGFLADNWIGFFAKLT